MAIMSVPATRFPTTHSLRPEPDLRNTGRAGSALAEAAPVWQNRSRIQTKDRTMKHGIHFISGLPRSGTTLLAALLRQNPRLHASMSSPVGSLILALLRQMSQDNETAVFIDDMQRTAILRAVFDAYYQRPQARKVVFDTNRLWCSKLPTLATLFPQAKVICCVRHVPWILDSIERLIRHNSLQPSKIFNFEPGGTVYSRVEGLGSGSGMVGFAWNALREAFYGEQADRLLLLSYETLTKEPRRAMSAIYEFINEPPFEHDFENVVYDAPEFDSRLGTPGLHRVGKSVCATERSTILPPDLFRRMESDSFWLDPNLNRHGVKVV
jgi:sulfotransferase